MTDLLRETLAMVTKAEEDLASACTALLTAKSSEEWEDWRDQKFLCECKLRFWREELEKVQVEEPLWLTSYGYPENDAIGSFVTTTREEAVAVAEALCTEEDDFFREDCTSVPRFECTYWGPTKVTADWLVQYTCNAEDIAAILDGSATLAHV